MDAAPILRFAARWSIPVIAPVMVVGALFAGPEAFHFWFESHTSVFELTVGAILIAAIVIGLFALFHPAVKQHRNLRGWLVAWTLALIYFAGEDLNWGQYIFGWETPEFFLERNKEDETNLHNMSTWFNQKPRMVVEFWILIAGVIVPLGWNWPRRALSKFVPEILWPGRKTLALGVVTSLVPVVEKSVEAIWGREIFGGVRPSEIQEILFAWFMLLYVIDLSSRLGPRSRVADAKAAASPAE